MGKAEQMIERATPMLKGIAGYYYRRSWGLRVLGFDDYLQEAYVTALIIHQNHQAKGADRVIQMVRKGAVYRCQRLWRKELFRYVHTEQVEIPEVMAEPLADSMSGYYTRETIAQIRRTLTGLRLQMFDVLLDPETADIDYRFCLETYPHNKHRPIQRGELMYLASYFNIKRRQAIRELSALRLQCNEIFEGGLA